LISETKFHGEAAHLAFFIYDLRFLNDDLLRLEILNRKS